MATSFGSQINRPVVWTNQGISLYHGTTHDSARSVINGIQLKLSKLTNDFGPGFYTTTVFDQAKAWAFTKWIRRGKTHHARPAVVEFVIGRDSLARLDALWFVRADRAADDYWSLIWHCRQGATDHARPNAPFFYNIVIGPVALQWQALQTLHDGDQISFHTSTATTLLDKLKGRIVWSLP